MSNLGLSLGGNPRSIAFWKVDKRLDGWKRGYLPTGGRLTLIQSVLSGCPVYFLPLLSGRGTVADRIEKKMNNFLWGGEEEKNFHLV